MSEKHNRNLAMPKIALEDIQELLVIFSKKTYFANAQDDEYKNTLDRVLSLLQSDYNFYLIDNTTGNLSSNYPSQLPIIYGETEVNRNADTVQSSQGDSQAAQNTVYNIPELHSMHELMSDARLARCRCRFPIPVIVYNGKCICRSSTLAGGPEILGRMGVQYFKQNPSSFTTRPTDEGNEGNEGNEYPEEDDEDNTEGSNTLLPFFQVPSFTNQWQFFDQVRSRDIKLLKALNIDTIFDLMVENKKVKYGLYCSSSEKVDRMKRYSDFNIVSIPYPGCEFFKEFRNNNLNSDKLFFQWRVAYCNANLCLPENPPLTQLKVNWTMYQQWDLTTLTKNYISYILNYIQETNAGILIHCISGWDRTPMFVSLIRLSLWADGLIHKNLDEIEILYFTLAYDWMMFGHHLCDRLKKEEDIFYFAFYFLKYLSSHEFSVLPSISKKQKTADSDLVEEVSEPDDGPQINVFEKDPLGSNPSLDSFDSVSYVKTPDAGVLAMTLEETGNTSGLLFADGNDGSVPGAPSTSRRTRMESTMSTESYMTPDNNQSADWQHVTLTGSLKGSDSSNSQDTPSLINIIEREFPELRTVPEDRKDRLKNVRKIFYQAYWTTIGKDVTQYKANPFFTTIINEVADKVKNFTHSSSSD